MSAVDPVWNIDSSHSSAEFSVRHLMIARVKGSFQNLQGTIVSDPDNFTGARIEATIDAAGIHTGDGDRDTHLRSGEFFEVEKFPSLTFKSRTITPAGNNRFNIIGDLTIRDVTKEVSLDTEFQGTGLDPWGQQRMALHAEGTLARSDFGLVWNMPLETGGVLVSDQVRLSIQVQAIRQDEA